MSIRIILADNHPVVREGLRSAIEKRGGEEIRIVGEASTGKEVLEMSQKSPADVYILDVSMPELNGIDTAERLIQADPACKIIILSIYDSRIFVEKAFRCGVRGYILKESATDEMIQGIQEVHRGRFFLSPVIAKYIVNGFIGRMLHRDASDKEAALTNREKEVLQLIAEGYTNQGIANELYISVKTVEAHKAHIMAKLHARNRTDLIRYALRKGFVRPDSTQF
ncbi:MAG TPA: DNA-binding response regulator [Candidatus Aminicenantes bacterium]|nr:DNA-binding response regulator [Candidatus Aminicenantes bacterium]